MREWKGHTRSGVLNQSHLVPEEGKLSRYSATTSLGTSETRWFGAVKTKRLIYTNK